VEWMPIRLPDSGAPNRGLRFWRSFSFGPLADLFVVDTRTNRSEQVDGAAGTLVTPDPEIDDPDRQMMEPEQFDALVETLADAGVGWHLIGNQTVFTRVAIPADLPGRDRLTPLGLGLGSPVFNSEQWDGYGAQQLALVEAMRDAGADPVVLTGDIHSSWANDIPLDAGSYAPVGPANNSVAVEFVTPSITSDGFAEVLEGEEQAVAATTGLQATNPHIRYLDGIGHGFAVLDVTPERVHTDWWHLSDDSGQVAAAAREDPDAGITHVAAWQSLAGTRQLVPADGPVGARSDEPRTASAAAAPPTGAPAPTTPVPVAQAAPAGRSLPATGGSVAAVALVAAGAAVGLRAVRTTVEAEPCE
jgi:alkaline phosphatase D